MANNPYTKDSIKQQLKEEGKQVVDSDFQLNAKVR